MLTYKTIVGRADTIDADINHLANEGWMVQQAFVVGSVDIGPVDEEGYSEMEMPIIAYLMFKEKPEAAPNELNDNGRPVRKVLGGKNL